VASAREVRQLNTGRGRAEGQTAGLPPLRLGP
jgi:hypothetical protein